MKRLELFAVPVFFTTMGIEYVHHRSRARASGARPGDYERRDTLTSLTLGTTSLIVPLVAPKLLAPITPGKGRFAKVLIGTAIAAGVMTTAADVVARRGATETDETDPKSDPDAPRTSDPHPSAVRSKNARSNTARRVAKVGSVTAVAAGGIAATTAWGHLTRGSAMWRRRVVPDLGNGAVALGVAVIGWDFLYYWNHRLWHESRFMWANHVMHHSSERYNLSTALRQTVADPFLMLVPYSALSLVGVRPEIIAAAGSINLLYQYWVHTDAVDRLGPFEEFVNTPSHHRVHHGVNPQYIDRNHAGILIIWDRLFGTFERENEKVVYGLTTNLNTFNPLRVAAHEYVEMFRDVANSTTWRDRLSFVVRGPGWAYERHRQDRNAHPADAQPVYVG